jgi:ubiquitin C-terminal hydrolase
MHYKGFDNIGNTCYLNSGLQLIIHNKDLCNIIIENSNNNSDLNNIADLIKSYYNSNTNNSLTPYFIKELVSKNNKEFNGFKQNDAFEFIIYFLDIIFDLLKSNKIYEIESKITIKCKLKTCLTKSIHNEKNNFLILDIDHQTNTLDDCYRNYKSIEKLMGDNSYYCDNCKKNTVASKRLEIINWSKHLIVVLKRFTHYGQSQKINKEIIVPTNWRHNYILKGIIFHSGSTSGGHYIYIGNHNNKWIMFNDNSTHEILDFQLNNYKNYGYIYYFERNI